MQATNIDFEDFLNFSREQASRQFRQTEEYRLLREATWGRTPHGFKY